MHVFRVLLNVTIALRSVSMIGLDFMTEKLSRTFSSRLIRVLIRVLLGKSLLAVAFAVTSLVVVELITLRRLRILIMTVI